MKQRPELLAALADAVAELTEPRMEKTRHDVPGKSKRGKWTIVRETHVAVLPSLLEALAEAVEPGVDGDILMVSSFESQPSADVGAIVAEARIRDQVLAWVKRLEIPPKKTLPLTISSLVSAQHSDAQLHDIVNDAKSWVRTARIATGYDPAPRTVDTPCPNCSKPHSLTMFGEDENLLVKCSGCKIDWPAEYIGLLTQQIEANRTHTTMTADGPCPVSPGCYRRGVHDEHWNSRGNTWLTPDEMRDAR